MADTAEHATVVATVESTPQTRSKVESPFVYVPAPLFGQATCREDVRRLMAYALVHRAKFNDVPIDLPALMHELLFRFGIDENLVFKLAEQAEQQYADFRARNLEKSPSIAKVPWRELTGAYAGDMSVDYFVVLCSVAACFPLNAKKARPKIISAKRLLRLAHGFSSLDSYRKAKSEKRLVLRTNFSEHKIRFITSRLSEPKYGLLLRETRGGKSQQYETKHGVKVNGRVGRQQTWYFPEWIAFHHPMLNVESYVTKKYVESITKKAEKALKRVRTDAAVALETQRVLDGYREQYKRDAMLLEPMPTREQAAVDVLAVLRKYGKSVLTAEQAASHRGSVRAEIHTPAGERLYLVQPVSVELSNLLTSAGCTVKRYQE